MINGIPFHIGETNDYGFLSIGRKGNSRGDMVYTFRFLLGITKTMAEASAEFAEPAAGAAPSSVATVPEGKHYTASVEWHMPDDSSKPMTGNFKEGEAYSAYVTFTGIDGYTFSDPWTTEVTLNGRTATRVAHDPDYTWVTFKVDYAVGAQSSIYINSVDFTVPSPVYGELPDISVVSVAQAGVAIDDVNTLYYFIDPANGSKTVWDTSKPFDESFKYGIRITGRIRDGWNLLDCATASVNGIPMDSFVVKDVDCLRIVVDNPFYTKPSALVGGTSGSIPDAKTPLISITFPGEGAAILDMEAGAAMDADDDARIQYSEEETTTTDTILEAAAACGLSDAYYKSFDIHWTLVLSDGTEMPLTEFSQPATVVLSIELDPAFTYKVLREHNGALDVLPATYNAAEKTLTFDSSLFSVFTVFQGDPIPVPDPEESEEPQPDPEESEEEGMPEESKPENSTSEESKTEESQSEETKPEETKPEDSTPEESKPVESQPAESEPAQNNSSHTETKDPEPVTSGRPDTGDRSNAAIWAMSLLFSAVGMMIVSKYGKKRTY